MFVSTLTYMYIYYILLLYMWDFVLKSPLVILQQWKRASGSNGALEMHLKSTCGRLCCVLCIKNDMVNVMDNQHTDFYQGTSPHNTPGLHCWEKTTTGCFALVKKTNHDLDTFSLYQDGIRFHCFWPSSKERLITLLVHLNVNRAAMMTIPPW